MNSEFNTTIMSAIGREHLLARGPGSRGPVFKGTKGVKCCSAKCLFQD